MMTKANHTDVTLDDIRELFIESQAKRAEFGIEDAPGLDTADVVECLVEGEHNSKSPAYVYIRNRLNELVDTGEIEATKEGRRTVYTPVEIEASGSGEGDEEIEADDDEIGAILQENADKVEAIQQAASNGGARVTSTRSSGGSGTTKNEPHPEGAFEFKFAYDAKRDDEIYFLCPRTNQCVQGRRLKDGKKESHKAFPDARVRKSAPSKPRTGDQWYNWKSNKMQLVDVPKEAPKSSSKKADTPKAEPKAEWPQIDEMTKAEIRTELRDRFNVKMAASAKKAHLVDRLQTARKQAKQAGSK